MKKFSRRDFLKGALAVSLLGGARRASASRTRRSTDVIGWARVFSRAMVYDKPALDERIVTAYGADAVLPVLGRATGESWSGQHDQDTVWWRTPEGYIHAVTAQFCPYAPTPKVLHPIRDPGVWIEIAAPLTMLAADPSPKAEQGPRVYAESVFRAVASAIDDEGTVWYRLTHQTDELDYSWVRAHHARILDPASWQPIAPKRRKSIHVDRATQTLFAYEDGQEVARARVSTGGRRILPEQGIIGQRTLPGDYNVTLKAPAARLTWGTPGVDAYDTLGVPYLMFFDPLIGIHGAYWHNNFGVPQSHGCINVRPAFAHWLYLWTTPFVDYDVRLVRSVKGIAVTVE